MSNIATGIALSGALETSTKGKEAQLGAAKFGAEKRIEEQRLKDKERSENEKDIRKNTSFDPQHENAFIQNLHEEEAVKKIAGIAEGLGSEDVNIRVEADKGLKEFKHGMKERQIMDKQMTEMLTAAKDPKYDINDPHIIGGIPYENALQALEDKRNWNPEMLKEIGDKFNSSFFDLSVDDQTGKPSINFNPLGAVVMDYDTEIFKGITKEEFSIEGEPKSYQLGNTMKEMSDLYPSPEGVMRSTITVAQDPRAHATAFRRAYREAKASNPDLSEAKFLEEGQRQHEGRLQAGEQGLAPTFREETINTQFERAAEDALKRAGGRREISAKEPQTPKAATPSAAKKALGEINIAVSSLGKDGAVATINTPGKPIKGNLQLSPSDQFFGIRKNKATGKNEKVWQKLDRTTTLIEATPVGIEFHGSDNAVITYASEYNKDGVKGGMNEYKVALNMQSFQQLSSVLGVDKANELLEKLRDASQPGQYKYADEWLDKLGLKRPPDDDSEVLGIDDLPD